MINRFIRINQLRKDNTVKSLAKAYLDKSLSNLVTMEILSRVENHRILLGIPK